MEHSKVYRCRKKVFKLIRPDGEDYNGYDLFMIGVIAVSLLPLLFKDLTPALLRIDRVAGYVFALDYFLRLITADFRQSAPLYTALLRYPFTPMAVIDLLSMLPSFLLSAGGVFRIFRLVRLLRALSLLRLFRLSRYARGLHTIAAVLVRQRVPLLSVFSLTCGYIFFCALIMFQLEPETFESFFDALYWSAVSLTTVGYGDLFPVTAPGKAVAALSAIVGIAVIALPAGVITAGYMEIWKERREQK